MDKKEFKKRVVSLSDRLYPMLRRLLSNDDVAKDALQEVMIKLWNGRGKLGKHPNLDGYIFLVARNYALDQLKKRSMDTIDIDSCYHINIEDNLYDRMESREKLAMVYKVIDQLPKQQREVIIMRDLDALEFHEIELLTDLNISHIRVLLSRARKEVRSKLNRIYD